MGYNRITTMEIKEILKRRKMGQSVSLISRSLGLDRKTIRKYLKAIKKHPDKEPSEVIKSLVSPEQMGRPTEKQDILILFKDEITELVNKSKDKLKPKSAFEVICQRHNLTAKVSYSSFKRFIRKHQIVKSSTNSTCRIESEPASQCQVDYCKVGLIYDSSTGKRKSVYAFIGTLSYSRHKFVEFVYSQNQKSFVQSHINMFNFFEGPACNSKA